MKFINMLVILVTAAVIVIHYKNPKPLSHPNSITFIVGEDLQSKNRFYHLAKEFFLTDPDYKTEIVTTSARSLEEIVVFLNQSKPPQGGNWKIVNIVTHSSEYGLQMPLRKNGGNITTKTWQELNITAQTGFSKTIQHLNKESVITIWGCSLGHHPQQLASLSELFKSTDGPTQIRSPSKRLYFERDVESQKIHHYYADEFWVYTPPKAIAQSDLAMAFEQRYPRLNIDWNDALAHKYHGDISEPSYDKKDVEIYFYAPLDVLETYRTLYDFMIAQPEIVTRLRAFQLNLNEMDYKLTESAQKNIIVIRCKSIKHAILRKSREQENAIMMFSHTL